MQRPWGGRGGGGRTNLSECSRNKEEASVAGVRSGDEDRGVGNGAQVMWDLFDFYFK